jgi:hypothetical protein
MNNNLITAVILTSSLIFSNTTYADENAQPIKHWSIGGGTYALIIDHEELGDDDFTGFTLSSTYAVSDSFSINGQYYSLEHNDFSYLDVSGVDISAYYGTGLSSKGFKAYVGAGVYSETLDLEGMEEDFSGVQLRGGFGYNWEAISLDLSVGIRSTGDYEDLADDGADMSAVSSALVLAFRF